jgi:hypothetical protein
MYKRYTYQTASGTDAIIQALSLLNSKRVILPTYTCHDILRAVKQSNCEYLIVDCGFDLQIDVEEVVKNAKGYDTVIVPHMFGIRANVESIRKNTNLKIIEDLSQCHGLNGLGQYADIVISSTNKSKWINLQGGGFLFSDEKLNLPIVNFDTFIPKIQQDLNRRTELAMEIKDAGIELIGEESSYLRAMYFTKNESTRTPYIPLHIIENKFGSFKVNSYINKVNWISIIV